MVPKGWKIQPLENIAQVTSGGTPSRAQDEYWNGSIPWVTTAEVHFNTITDTREKITKKGLDSSSAKLFPPNTLLIAMYGQGKTRGQVAKLGIEATTNQACAAILLKEGFSVDYYFQFFQSQYKNIRNMSNSGGQDNLSAGLLKFINVPVPPLSEQNKIAKILSIWDKAITITKQLLTNSQQQKKALMQQLLTGKKRFSGFKGAWKGYHLADIAEIIVSPVDKKSEEGEVPIELCNYIDVYYNNYISRKINFMKATASASEIKKYSLKIDDVIITKDSETPGDIAIPALVREDLNGVVCGYHLAIIRPKTGFIDGFFLNFLFSMPKTRYYFFTLASGATRFGLPVVGIHKAYFELPPIEEQKKIASILFVADHEIEVLQQKLDCLKQEKKSLMQQLLTGKRQIKLTDTGS